MIKRNQFYIKHLKEVILPFWERNSPDMEFGGFYTCFTNDGSQLISTDKYLWSQGRFIWLLSKLSCMDIFPKEKKAYYLGLARNTLNFILKHCFLDHNLTCAFLFTREGVPKEQTGGSGLAPSTFADCFIALALIGYIQASADVEKLPLLEKLLKSIMIRYKSNTFSVAPFFVPAGAKYHAVPMIILNLYNECADLYETLGQPVLSQHYTALAKEELNTILKIFVKENFSLVEISTPGEDHSSRLLFSYVNPGHVLEDCWFMLKVAQKQNDLLSIQTILKVIKQNFNLGWDQEYGGIRYYCHEQGGLPRGDTENEIEHAAAKQILADCNNKLWWPNTEALYVCLLAYHISGDIMFKDMYERLHTYIFKTFPNPDQSIGEWIQIRDHFGKPLENSVGGRLPVKDPYHITRNLILLIELTKKMEDSHLENTL